MMKTQTPIAALFAAFAAVLLAVPGTSWAATEAESNSTFVFANKADSTFWHTATNATLSLPVEFPPNALSATLTVSAPGYSASYAVVSEGDDFMLTLPAASSPETENVYDLILAFSDGTVRTARLGLVQSFGVDGEAATRVLSPPSVPVWASAAKVTVLPIPAGTTSFTINGVETDTGLDGDAGWFALTLGGGQTANLALSDVNAAVFTASLTRPFDATVLFMR